MRPKNPQPPEDQTDVVAGTAQDGIQRIAQFALLLLSLTYTENPTIELNDKAGDL